MTFKATVLTLYPEMFPGHLEYSLAGKALGFNVEDRITLLFCGSKKSLASGIPMAQVLFAGHAVGAIVLPLMLFHQIQLMVCGVLAARFGKRPDIDG